MANSSSMVNCTASVNPIELTGSLLLFNKQLNRFRDIKFIEESHEYFHGTSKFKSVTQWLKKIVPEFNEDYWLKYKTLQEMGLKVQKLPDNHLRVNGEVQHYTEIKIDTSKLKNDWSNKSKTALSKGTSIHRDFELGFQGKYTSDLVWNYVQARKDLIPIRSEYIVADYENKIAGQMDGLFLNTDTGLLEIHDYKTDKEIKYSNRYESFLPPLDFMSNCNFNKYTIQLNMYKHCIEKYTDLKIDKMYVQHVLDKIESIEIPDCPDIIKMLLR